MLCYFIDIHMWFFPFYDNKHFFLFIYDFDMHHHFYHDLLL